jgi:hypothetical protein
MRQTWYDIVPQQTGWAIRTGETTKGKYATRDEAFAAAVTQARKMRDKGEFAQVRILHHANDGNDDSDG